MWLHDVCSIFRGSHGIDYSFDSSDISRSTELQERFSTVEFEKLKPGSGLVEDRDETKVASK
jgi:hypothetical protein